MSDIKTGGPAFPVEHEGHNRYESKGMTLRDYFAAKALAGMLAFPGDDHRGNHYNNNTPDGVAAMAYEYADAMLRAREAV